MKPDNEQYTRHNSLRLPTFDYGSRRIYFVTIVAHDRRAIFNDDRVANETINCLRVVHQKLHFNLYVYCLMPDHFHALIGAGESGKPLGSLCGAFKSLSTRAYWQWHAGRLWQRQFYDHVIRNEEDYFETRSYIRLNPVRKGLVSDWREWKYTGGIDALNGG